MRHARGLFEACATQRLDPLCRGKQRIVASQIVGEMLPAFDQSGRHVEPGEVVRGLYKDQQAARCKQLVQATKSQSEVGAGMDDIGCYDNIEGARQVPLRGGVFVQVEPADTSRNG